MKKKGFVLREKNRHWETFAKLQNLSKFAARIITDIKKYGHITPALEQLDWLPVHQMLSLRDATNCDL